MKNFLWIIPLITGAIGFGSAQWVNNTKVEENKVCKIPVDYNLSSPNVEKSNDCLSSNQAKILRDQNKNYWSNVLECSRTLGLCTNKLLKMTKQLNKCSVELDHCNSDSAINSDPIIP